MIANRGSMRIGEIESALERSQLYVTSAASNFVPSCEPKQRSIARSTYRGHIGRTSRDNILCT